jgi:NAD+ kinase
LSAVLVTHTHPQTSSEGVRAAVEAAKKVGVELVAPADEHRKHGAAADGLGSVDELPERPDVCIVLGGDGSILYALRRYAHTGVPVFGINFGTIGFLAAVEREQLEDGLRRALEGDYEVMSMPALDLGMPAENPVAFNDVVFARRPHGRVAELSYRVTGEEVGNVRCDGLVAATPAGSTGYNLANAGPILAWGVEGYVVSFIAPHTLTARALVVAPGDVLQVGNAAGREPVDVSLDGEHCGELAPGEEVGVGFRDGVGSLAQLPGANFYTRIREKFGRLAK